MKAMELKKKVYRGLLAHGQASSRGLSTTRRFFSRSLRRLTVSSALFFLLAACLFGALWLSAAQQKPKGIILVPEKKTPKSRTRKNTRNSTDASAPVLLPDIVTDSRLKLTSGWIPQFIELPAPNFESEPVPPPPAMAGTRPEVSPLAEVTFTFKTPTYDKSGRIKEEREKTVDVYRENLSSNILLELVKIPSGEFMMGGPESETDSLTDTNRERPRHKVKVPSFWIGKYEVTQAQWRAVAQLPQIKIKLIPDPSKFKGDDNPVDSISWYEAVEFCARLEKKTSKPYRLLTEAEWEYAARAGTTTPFAFGETITPEIVNYDGNTPFYNSARKGASREKTIPVGSLGRANAFGLFDMHGNLWEWCQDQWHPDYKDAPTDGSAWESQKPSFNITAQSIVRLRSGGVPDEVLNKLQRLKDYVVTGEEQFLARLKMELGEEQTTKFKPQILEYASWDIPRVLRGGSWLDGGSACRSASRSDYGYPIVRRDDHGLRIAVSKPF